MSNLLFVGWFNRLNRIFQERFELCLDEVIDHNWYELFEEGFSEEQAIEDFVFCNEEFANL